MEEETRGGADTAKTGGQIAMKDKECSAIAAGLRADWSADMTDRDSGLPRKHPISAHCSSDHDFAEAMAPNTTLPITDGARQILRAIRGKLRER
jgi:hypothetical protein